MNSSRLSGGDGIEVDMTMDYRYFFLSNKLYYDELSTMSLLYANSIYMKNSGIKVNSGNNPGNNNLRIKDLMEFYGFKNVKTYYLGTVNDDGYEEGDICLNYHREDTHKGRVTIGYRTIEYHGIYKTVIGIVIRGTAEDDDWDTDFDIGDINLRNALLNKTTVKSGKADNVQDAANGSTKNSRIIDTYCGNNQVLDYDKKYYDELKHFAYGYPDWTHNQHHAGFDIVANRIIEEINNYYDKVSGNFDSDIEAYDENTIETAITANSVSNYSGDIVDGGVSFWITGHSMGAGVANLVAANLIDKGYRDNVYCYTFAAPNTFYYTDNGEGRDSTAIPGHKVLENYKEPHGANYRCIFNIVNEDDFVPEVPMSKCGWTKYGRTAKISFNGNKSNIDRIIRNENKYSTIHYDWTTTKRFINEQYIGDTKTIESIVDSFNSIFEDEPDNMRYDAYLINNNDFVILHSSQEVIELPMPKNVKPYQKINTSGEDIIEYQMPAYFMQYLAYAMHSGFPLIVADSTQAGFLFTNFAKKYIKTKNVIMIQKNKIVSSHYLESYYLLTKRISIIDFE